VCPDRVCDKGCDAQQKHHVGPHVGGFRTDDQQAGADEAGSPASPPRLACVAESAKQQKGLKDPEENPPVAVSHELTPFRSGV